MHLYETHLPVANTEIAKEFYTEIVGLRFAYRDPTSRHRLSVGGIRRSKGMIGLWGPNTAYGQRKRNRAKMPRGFRLLLRSIARRD